MDGYLFFILSSLASWARTWLEVRASPALVSGTKSMRLRGGEVFPLYGTTSFKNEEFVPSVRGNCLSNEMDERYLSEAYITRSKMENLLFLYPITFDAKMVKLFLFSQ